MSIGSKNVIAMLLLFVTITGLVVSSGEDVACAGELPGVHERTNSPPVHNLDQTHDSSCPCAPLSPQLPDDHLCTGVCGCPCQAPLSSAIIFVSYSPLLAILHHAEITRHIPEVYLSLFVPPDSAAI